MRRPELICIPAGVAFLETLAAVWRERAAADGFMLHDGLILLPTRRAARELAAAFLRAADGAPILLPRIVAFGGLDEAPLALAGALSLPPAIAPMHRLAVLAQLILAMKGDGGAPRHADRAWTLAGELALLMDEAERAEIDLAQGLADAVDEAHAAHWGKTLTFLRIVTQAWPAYLEEQGLMNPAARQVRLLEAQAAAWREAAPAVPILAVSGEGDIPAVGALLRVVGGLPHGAVVLPGLDTGMDAAAWEAMEATHPQSGLRDLLGRLDARREDVRVVGTPRIPAERAVLLRQALLPAACLGAWQQDVTAGTEGLSLLAASDVQDEAVCIAMILRDALEVPRTVAALVTPDRGLAQRVAVELARFGVVADDSAGEKLAETPPAVFLRLLAAAVAEAMAPIALLALLKHPLAAGGLAPAEMRRRARRLELACLRGPRPEPGLSGLRRALDRAAPDDLDLLADLLARVERCLAPLLRGWAAAVIPPGDLLAALVAAGEALAETDSTAGPAVLWALDEGEALAQLLAEALEALPVLPAEAPASLPRLFDALLAGAVVRSRRALRGRGGAQALHPRVFIWGLLEARLQSADLIVLGGLTDGVWPAATDPGPWLSRPMRARAGLPSPELRIGQAAQDFCLGACAAPRVVLSVPRRRDNAPAVPSRWIVRLAALLRRQGGLPLHPASGWAAVLDRPAAGARPVEAPQPRPPVAARPRRLNVTDVAVLLADPYAIYARRILGLEPLDPVEQSADFRDYGNVVHAALDGFVRQAGLGWPEDAAARMAAAMQVTLREAGLREAMIAWWTPRLRRIADWVDREERRRRAANPPVAISTEAKGIWSLPRAGGPFTLHGRADRLERGTDGALSIVDYKTGTLPTKEDVDMGRAPQLLLEAAMAREGAFGAEYALEAAELSYWRLSGGHEAGKAMTLYKGDRDATSQAAADAVWHLIMLVDRYDDPLTAYPAPVARRGRYAAPYAQLARVAEWGGAGWGEGDGDDEADPLGEAE